MASYSSIINYVFEFTIIYRNIRNSTGVQCLVFENPMLRTGNHDRLIKNDIARIFVFQKTRQMGREIAIN